MKNFESYKLNLKKSLEQKLFFTKQLDLSQYDLIVDYGCGTGDVLMALVESGKLKPDCKLVGYDTNPDMISYAKSRLVNSKKNITYVDNFLSLQENIKIEYNSLVIFSSVLHEIEAQEQLNIIDNIMLTCNTIVIRDMIAPQEENKRISRKIRKKVLKEMPRWQYDMFKSTWGKIKRKKNLYRFLLMNEFVDNFETEVKEDYFSVLWDKINDTLVSYGYARNVTDYTLSYRREQVLKRFGLFMGDYTHRNAIYYLPTEFSHITCDVVGLPAGDEN